MQAPDVAGYQVSIRNYVLSLEDRVWDRPAQPNDFRLPAAQGYPAYVDHQNVRLFRRDPRLIFVGRVHESVGPSIEAAGLRLGQRLLSDSPLRPGRRRGNARAQEPLLPGTRSA